ncbi:hypothetical protein [Paenibacillus favisporus]|uniref:hypothetical protein n=1 Tax=Paenibacillus favisporus TaxID=221028 RepID=UPI0013D1317B|nr:hypothetical protein [Paenibacillus favisporus]
MIRFCYVLWTGLSLALCAFGLLAFWPWYGPEHEFPLFQDIVTVMLFLNAVSILCYSLLLQAVSRLVAAYWKPRPGVLPLVWYVLVSCLLLFYLNLRSISARPPLILLLSVPGLLHYWISTMLRILASIPKTHIDPRDEDHKFL